MDSYDIFKQLSTGAKFNFKRYKNDAVKLKLIKPKDDVSIVNNGDNEDITDQESLIDNNINDNNFAKEEENINIMKSIKRAKKGKQKREDIEKLLFREKINHIRKVNKIHCQGKNIPDPISTFEELNERYGIQAQLLINISECGYKLPTPIQMQTFPVMLEGRHILATAATGSGKTCAFLIPIIHHLTVKKLKKNQTRLRALIVCPSRELANQTYRECLRLIIGTELRCHVLSKAVEKKGSKKSNSNYDILISAPNRLVYYLKNEKSEIKLDNLEWLVMDESDKLFESLNGQNSIRNQLSYIYRKCNSTQMKKAFFSATYDQDVGIWASKTIKKLVRVIVGERNGAPKNVEQKLEYVGDESGKLVALRQLIQRGFEPPVLIFVQSKERAQELFNELVYDSIRCDVIHSDKFQHQRDNAVRGFREGKIWVLICTELISRGIDFKGVNLVINYDMPPTLVSYIHRIGRTGRAGLPGKAVTYYTEKDMVIGMKKIVRVMKESGNEIPEFLEKKHYEKDKRPRSVKLNPERDSILTKPLYDTEKEKTLKKQIKGSKQGKKLKTND